MTQPPISEHTRDMTLRLARDVLQDAIDNKPDWRFVAGLLMYSLNACVSQDSFVRDGLIKSREAS